MTHPDTQKTVGGVTTNYEFPTPNNRLTVAKDAAGQDVEKFCHDDHGQLIADRFGSYTYTPFGMLRGAIRTSLGFRERGLDEGVAESSGAEAGI